MTRLDDRLHRAGDDLLKAAITIPPRLIGDRRHPLARAVGWAAAALAVAALVALPLWLGALGDDPVGPPVGGIGPSPLGILGGEPFDDGAILAAIPGPDPVPGTVLLVASRHQDGFGTMHFLAYEIDPDDIDSPPTEDVPDGAEVPPGPWYCTATVVDDGEEIMNLGAACGPAETFRSPSSGRSSECHPDGRQRHVLTVYGLSVYGVEPDLGSAVIAFTDGSAATVDVVNGTILLAWEGSLYPTAVTVDGAPVEGLGLVPDSACGPGSAAPDTTATTLVPAPLAAGPVSDDAFIAAHGPLGGFYVPGSAVLVARRDDQRYGPLYLFFFDAEDDEWSSAGSEWLCATAIGPILADPDPNGKTLRLGAGTTCGPTDSPIHDRGLVAGGTCVPGYEHTMLAVYGIDPTSPSATVTLTDGRSFVVEIVNRAILVAWDGTAGVDEITLHGASAADSEWLDGTLEEHGALGRTQCD